MTNKKPILPLGLMDDGRLVVDPYPDLARLVIGAAGSAKTTSVIMPTAQALLGYRDISFLLNDCKSGECYSQLAPVAEKYNIPFGCIDDFGLYGFANPQRLKLNPFGAIHAAAKYSPGTLGFTIETATHCLIEEVSDGKRNFFFRETPRDILQTAIQTILELMPDQLYPGGLAAFIGDIETFRLGLNEALHDGSTALKARARSVLRMMDDDPDGFTKHYQACLTALKIYMPGSILAT
ncbi:MAG: hypothetical protein OIF54_05335, partial [Cohaesibacter sp.]|nr:hypothetical protein [Cohaesibacter sp.]